MKSLLLVAFMMVATVVSSVTAVEYCPAGTIDTSVNITLDDPAVTEHTIAAGCAINPYLNIDIDATSSTGTTDSTPTTVTIANTNVGASGVVIFRGSTNEIAQVRSPYIVNILNNWFNNDACLFFSGAHAPNSVINIRGNRFNASSPLYQRMPRPFQGGVSTWASSIIFYDLILFSAKVHITENNIYGSDIAGNFNIIGVYVYSAIYYMGDDSQFNVNSNNITAICNPLVRNGICGYGVMTNNLYIYANSQYNIDNNNFNTAGCLVSSFPNLINPVASGKITFNGNRGNVNTMILPHTITSSLQPFVLFNSINLQSASSIAILSNTFDITGTSGMFGFLDDFIFGETTSLTLANNKITTHDCSPGIYFGGHSTTGTAFVRILNNEFYRDDEKNLDVPMLYFGTAFGLKETTTLTVAYNTFGARVAPASTMLMDLSASAVNSFTFSADAKLMACGNVVAGKARLSTTEVWSVVHNSLRSRVMVTGCAGTPLPTNRSVATTTTRAATTGRNVTTTFAPNPTINLNNTQPPLGNHGAGKISRLSAVALVGAALAALATIVA